MNDYVVFELRGVPATALNEIAQQSGVEIELWGEAVRSARRSPGRDEKNL